MRIVISGATGSVGRAVTRHLQRRGDQVTACVRELGRAGRGLGADVARVERGRSRRSIHEHRFASDGARASDRTRKLV